MQIIQIVSYLLATIAAILGGITFVMLIPFLQRSRYCTSKYINGHSDVLMQMISIVAGWVFMTLLLFLEQQTTPGHWYVISVLMMYVLLDVMLAIISIGPYYPIYRRITAR